MMGYSEKWYYQRDIDRYEKLEQKGKLGTKRARILAYWRRAKQKYPKLISVSICNGVLGISKTGE